MKELQYHCYLLVLAGIALLGGYVSACKTECEDKAVVECAESTDCKPITASKIVDGCATESAAVGCMDTGTGCDDSLVVARDSNGAQWQFSNLCVPQGWTDQQSDPIYPQCE